MKFIVRIYALLKS